MKAEAIPIQDKAVLAISSPILLSNKNGCILDLVQAFALGSNEHIKHSDQVVSIPYQTQGTNRKRKRKSNGANPVQQRRALKEQAFHNECVAPMLWPIIDQLREEWARCNPDQLYLSHSSLSYLNTDIKRQKSSCDLLTLRQQLDGNPISRNQVEFTKDNTIVPLNCVFDTLVTNKRQSNLIIENDDGFVASFDLPPNCSFLMSDISNMLPLIKRAHQSNGFDVIVMDPPWPSKAVKRSNPYSIMDDIYDLFKLPVRELTAKNCLFCIWTTNNDKHRRFVEHRLIPDWGLTFLARWYWVKITADGRQLFPRQGSNRQTYEMLYIAAMNAEAYSNIPRDYVIMGCPIGHSRKPPLDVVLRQFIPQQEAPLELFARNLTAGWTSWGNEVLHFQLLQSHQDQNVEMGIQI